MAAKKLSKEQQNWLFMHFPEMTNRELAQRLSEMQDKENKKRLEHLKALLKDDFQYAARKVIQKEMDSIMKFKGISESLVKRYARDMHCPPKSRTHIVACSQERAKITNLKRWVKKAEKVDNIMDWLRNIEEKDVKFCLIENNGKLNSMRVSINKFNQFEGYSKSVYLTSQFIPEISVLRVNGLLYRCVK